MAKEPGKRAMAENEFITRSIGPGVICQRCGATLNSYADQCRADLDDACEGFRRIEEARHAFQKGDAA